MKLMEEREKEKLIELALKIKTYVLTEKIVKLDNAGQCHQYAFIVDPSLRKPQLKFLLELLFSIKIRSIRTINLHTPKKRVGKFLGKKARSKKVYITLEANQKIENLLN